MTSSIKMIINDINVMAFLISFFILIIILYKKNKTNLQKTYLFFQIFITIWTFGNIFDYLSSKIVIKQFWMNFEYIGASYVGVVSLIISIYQTKSNIRKRTIYFMLIPSITMLISAITNPMHHMFYLINADMSVHFRILFWIHVYIQYAYIISSIIIYIMNMILKKKLNISYIIMILGSLVPLIANALIIFDIIVTHQIDLTPIAFTISNILFSISVFRYGAFDIIPMATNLIFKDIEQSILIANQDNDVIEFNDAAIEFFRYFNVCLVKGKNTIELKYKISEIDIDNKEEVDFFIKRILDKSIIKEKLNINIKEAGKYYEIEYSPILDSKGNYLGHVIVGKEVTIYIELYNDIQKRNEILQLKNLEINKLYEEAKKYNDLANDFISIVSHEFRTPLNVITCSLQILNNNADKTINENKKWINMLSQNSLRLMKLINNLLDHSKIDAGFVELHESNIELISFVKNIVYSIESYTKSKGIEIEYSHNENKIEITIDEEKLEKIILNLLSNATKFTKRNGKIMVNVRDGREEFYISVKDNGIGIPKEEQEKIFKKFKQIDNLMTRHNEGSGIGLSLVQNFIKIMNGNIIVKSEYGKGSEFIISFPKKYIKIKNNINDKLLVQNDLNQKIDIEFSDIS